MIVGISEKALEYVSIRNKNRIAKNAPKDVVAELIEINDYIKARTGADMYDFQEISPERIMEAREFLKIHGSFFLSNDDD